MLPAQAVGPLVLSKPLLAVTAVIALGLAGIAPLYSLILFDLTLVPVLGFWVIGGIRFDPGDLVLGCIVLALLIRTSFSPFEVAKKTPYFLAWLLLGTFMTLSYVNSPVNAHNLTDPVRIAYQVYRYCWKPLLYFPLCLLLVRNLKQARHVWMAILIGGNLCAIETVWQGYAGHNVPSGPFETGNALGAILVVPAMIAGSGMIFPTSRFHWLFSTASSLLIARAILFSGSRGAMVAVIGGAAALGCFALWTAAGRSRILKLVPTGILSILALIAVRPDVLDRPTVQHAFSLFQGTRTANMQWRMTHRWPHFIQIAIDNPMIGIGTYTDKNLSKDANTPHNGYIALAVKYGFPVLALFLYFILRLLLNCLMAFRRLKRLDERIFFLTLAASVLGIMTHNLVDTTLTEASILKYFWICCAFAAAFRYQLWQPTEESAEKESRPRQPGHLAPARQLS